MALSDAEKLKLKEAEHRAVLRDLILSMELLEYYRDMAPAIETNSTPPPNYWIKEIGEAHGWGVLHRGYIQPKGKEDTKDDAVAACWAHLESITPRQVKQTPKPSTAHLDLDDILSDEEEPEQPTRKRRRRVAE